MSAIDKLNDCIDRLKRVDPDIENNEVIKLYEQVRLEDKTEIIEIVKGWESYTGEGINDLKGLIEFIENHYKKQMEGE